MKNSILGAFICLIVMGILFAAVTVSGYTHIHTIMKVVDVVIGMLAAIYGFAMLAKLSKKKVIIQ